MWVRVRVRVSIDTRIVRDLEPTHHVEYRNILLRGENSYLAAVIDLGKS